VKGGGEKQVAKGSIASRTSVGEGGGGREKRRDTICIFLLVYSVKKKGNRPEGWRKKRESVFFVRLHKS